MKRTAILQSNYIPWKGYFDIIASVDEFIIYDDVQYTKNDWRNRNKIKTAQGLKWLTVPVKLKGRFGQEIREVEIDDPKWAASHWATIVQNYRHAKYFKHVAPLLETLYTNSQQNLSEQNRAFISGICSYLEIGTRITNSWDYVTAEGQTERLVDLCRQTGAEEYISGPSAKDYIDQDQFNAAGITLSWVDYSGYPEYQQLWGEFAHGVSMIDLLFNCGPDSMKYMKHGKK